MFFIELFEKDKGYVYDKESINMLEESFFKILSIEMVQNILVYRISINLTDIENMRDKNTETLKSKDNVNVKEMSKKINLNSEKDKNIEPLVNLANDKKEKDFIYEFNNIKCVHKSPIKFTSISRLPHEGWEDLIDFWSCHNQEFKHFLKYKIKEKKCHLLFSDFYVFIPKESMPECCYNHIQRNQFPVLNNSVKMYFNEFTHNLDENLFIFSFFSLYFKERDRIVLRKISDTNNSNSDCFINEFYTVKLFYNCKLLKGSKYTEAIKVGYKIEKRPSDKIFTGINDYFTNLIIQNIEKFSIKIEIMNFKISFITQNGI